MKSGSWGAVSLLDEVTPNSDVQRPPTSRLHGPRFGGESPCSPCLPPQPASGLRHRPRRPSLDDWFHEPTRSTSRRSDGARGARAGTAFGPVRRLRDARTLFIFWTHAVVRLDVTPIPARYRLRELARPRSSKQWQRRRHLAQCRRPRRGRTFGGPSSPLPRSIPVGTRVARRESV